MKRYFLSLLQDKSHPRRNGFPVRQKHFDFLCFVRQSHKIEFAEINSQIPESMYLGIYTRKKKQPARFFWESDRKRGFLIERLLENVGFSTQFKSHSHGNGCYLLKQMCNANYTLRTEQHNEACNNYAAQNRSQRLGFRHFEQRAINAPDHAPVPGSGIATKRNRPSRSYLVT